MKRLPVSLLLAAALALAATAHAAQSPVKPLGRPKAPVSEKTTGFDGGTFSGLKFRSIGPALTSGRVVDLAIHPSDPSTWYLAAAYGGVWKTVNAGTSWKPVFDAQGTSSIGCVSIDPANPATVWVGSGENNSQRSVGWGDGVYRSEDGGRSWTNMGLKASGSIGMVKVHPKDSKTVFVAAFGPLWSAGGDRGLFKTTDAGKSWRKVLDVDHWTGANEVHFDPRDPQLMYATTYQRHRKVWTLLNGGPGGGIWKSTDGGETWTKLKSGLPAADVGRIGLTLPPLEPGVLVATIEAQDDASGTYRSADGGLNWEKLNGQLASSPQYYQELFSDPSVPGRLYSIDTFLQTSDDGGRTWRRAGNRARHVDDHVVWIDPKDSRHLLIGGDGGLYETFDRCATFKFFTNLPITQFYKIALDDALPFYNVYGGTQDNNTQGGPSRTTHENGIRSSDWFILLGGDGFQPRAEPGNPNVLYAQYQHAGLVRFDRGNGESVDIQPQTEPGEAPSRWNWDSPLNISPHAPKRLYFSSQRVYRSDDRGDSWRPVSPDLTRQTDRNQLEVMGRVWSVDAVSKNASTSFFGNIVSFDESPLAEGLLLVGTDDGLIQISEDGGGAWRRIDSAPLVGEWSYVSRVVASQHARSRVYAAFDRHKMGDYKPYLMRSEDLGKSWRAITTGLPDNGSVYALVEDHVDPDLLFAGTEFGVFCTKDGGRNWFALKGGLPVQCVRDLAIHKRENDLVVGSFSRGFYILDDYSPLRATSLATLDAKAALFPVKPALMYVPSSPLGGEGRAEQGEMHYFAENPPFGAIFTYRLKDDRKRLKDARREKEKEDQKAGKGNPYPSWDRIREEEREEAPVVLLTVTDDKGQVVRRLTGPAEAGFQRVAWDFRYPASVPAQVTPRTRGDWGSLPTGPLATPGRYRVQLSERIDGVETPLSEPVAFDCVPLVQSALPPADRSVLAAFHAQVASLQRSALGTQRALSEATSRAAHLKVALDDTPRASAGMRREALALERRCGELSVRLNGDRVLASRDEPSPPSLLDRVNQVVYGSWTSTSAPTATHRRNHEIAAADLQKDLDVLRAILTDLADLERRAEAAGAPWTPGRLPDWKGN